MEILLIEDEPTVISLIKRGLNDEKYNISVAMDGYTGLKMAGMNTYDLIILDIMLPGMDGLEVCHNIRMANRDIPILILSALDQTEDIVAGFERDADDYLIKPFKLEELKARIKRHTRRAKRQRVAQKVIKLADLSLDIESRDVTRAGKSIALTATEYRLLEHLMVNHNKILPRLDILEEVWGMDFNLSTNVVDVYVNYLRKKIDKNFSPKLIHTVIGMGYVMRVQYEDED
ncbi:response regulator transcription factor [Olivibacter sp. SDN3]|uniref:response regulator transcription factor n=1 Tax=Olivibacter sp. SDN3 TaxID=2764720 RepID=UPI0016510B07|nr:response regulator transcription factor [Olivibacter sp. SDN3]QNL50867.1 response regulator transcription factor [Olivibacter sp. SDN3]